MKKSFNFSFFKSKNEKLKLYYHLQLMETYLILVVLPSFGKDFVISNSVDYSLSSDELLDQLIEPLEPGERENFFERGVRWRLIEFISNIKLTAENKREITFDPLGERCKFKGNEYRIHGGTKTMILNSLRAEIRIQNSVLDIFKTGITSDGVFLILTVYTSEIMKTEIRSDREINFTIRDEFKSYPLIIFDFYKISSRTMGNECLHALREKLPEISTHQFITHLKKFFGGNVPAIIQSEVKNSECEEFNEGPITYRFLLGTKSGAVRNSLSEIVLQKKMHNSFLKKNYE